MPILVAAREKTLDLAAYGNPTGELLDGSASAAASVPAQASGEEAAPAAA
ncbi:hypothetical protein ACF9IK_15145 [Kitasatospora hibisci]